MRAVTSTVLPTGQGGVFPPPLYNIETKRPFFTEDMQEVCLEVRRRNCGINGKPVMFYAQTIRITGDARSRSGHRQSKPTSTPT